MALLKIDPPFEESDTVKPIQINDMYENLEEDEVLISGWGATTDDFPDQLQKILMKISSQGKGGKFDDFFPRFMVFNMDSSEGEGACFGDSGGNNDVEDKRKCFTFKKYVESNFCA